jgi:hypothetical protein
MLINVQKENDQVVSIEAENIESYAPFADLAKTSPLTQTFNLYNGDAGSDDNVQILTSQLAQLENLQELDLNVNTLQNSEMNCGADLARILERNKINYLGLYGDVEDIDAFFDPIMEAMESNTSLEVLYVYAQNFGPEIYRKLAHIVEIKSKNENGIKILLDGAHINISDEQINILVKALHNPDHFNCDIEYWGVDMTDYFPQLDKLAYALESTPSSVPYETMFFRAHQTAAGEIVCEGHCEAHSPRPSNMP